MYKEINKLLEIIESCSFEINEDIKHFLELLPNNYY